MAQAALLALCLAAALFAGCHNPAAGGNPPTEAEQNKASLAAAGPLAVTAHGTDGRNVPFTITFDDAAVTITLEGEAHSYPYEMTAASITLAGAGEGGENAVIGYTIANNTLTLSGLDKIAELSLSGDGTAPEPAPGPTPAPGPAPPSDPAPLPGPTPAPGSKPKPPAAWTAVTITGFAGDSINSVAYKEGVGFIAGSGRNYADPVIAISANGISGWHSQSIYKPPFDRYVGKIVNLPGVLLITRGSGVHAGLYSTDGVTWTVTEIGFGTKGFAYANGVYVVGGQHGQAAYSTNAADWTLLPKETTTFDNGSANSLYINAIAYGNGRFVMAGGRGHTAWSADGRTWQGAQGTASVSEVIFDGPGGFIDCMVFGAGKFVALGGMDGYDAKAAWSTDGVTWTQGGDPHLIAGNGSPSAAYGGGYFLAADSNGNASYSADGVTWTAIANTTFAMAPIKGIAYGNNMFVMVGGDGKAAYAKVTE
jgi:hypothetical protein